MTTTQVRAFRGTALAFFGAGIVFLFGLNSTLGITFFVIAIAFMAASTKQGRELAQNRTLMIVLVLVGLIALAGVIAALLLLPKLL
jgi:hypothetical protein